MMTLRVIRLLEPGVILLIIASSFFFVRKFSPQEIGTFSLQGMQDSQFSYITKTDADTIKSLVKKGHIGYISDTECVSDCMMLQQYILAPLFIDYGNMANEYTFGKFSSEASASQQADTNGLEIIQKNGSFYLFKLTR